LNELPALDLTEAPNIAENENILYTIGDKEP